MFKCRCWCEASAPYVDRTASLVKVQASPVTSTSQCGAAGLLASMPPPPDPKGKGLFWGLLLDPGEGMALNSERISWDSKKDR